ncbi:MAG TPA: CBS domain-containing protein [Burkholderiaceae bacterium]
MHIGNICTRSLATCRREASAQEIGSLMRDLHVSDVVVIDERGGRMVPLGFVTEHDLVVRVIAPGARPDQVRAADLMASQFETVRDSEFVYDAIALMRRKRLLRLPVIDGHGALVGVLTADDVTDFLASELTELARIAPHHASCDTPEREPIFRS